MGIVGDANKQLKTLQDNIANIKSQGVEVKTQIADLVKNADERQKSTIKEIQEKIQSLSDVSALESQVKLLKKDIDKLAVGIKDTANTVKPDSRNPEVNSNNQPGNQPGNQSGDQPGNQPGNQSGGYTYGKSRSKYSRKSRSKRSLSKSRKSKKSKK